MDVGWSRHRFFLRWDHGPPQLIVAGLKPSVASSGASMHTGSRKHTNGSIQKMVNVIPPIWIDGWHQPQKCCWLGDVLLLLQSPFECSHRFPQKEKFILRNHVKTCKNHVLSSRSSFEFSSEFYSYRWTKAGVSERLESLKSNVLSKRKLYTRLELVNS